MKVLVRTHPTAVYFVTGKDAQEAREGAGMEGNSDPCFVTDDFGCDGWIWETAEEFEKDWSIGPGMSDPSFESIRVAVLAKHADFRPLNMAV